MLWYTFWSFAPLKNLRVPQIRPPIFAFHLKFWTIFVFACRTVTWLLILLTAIIL